MLEYIYLDIKYVMVIHNKISKVIRRCVLTKITFYEAQSLPQVYLVAPCEHFTEKIHA